MWTPPEKRSGGVADRRAREAARCAVDGAPGRPPLALDTARPSFIVASASVDHRGRRRRAGTHPGHKTSTRTVKARQRGGRSGLRPALRGSPRYCATLLLDDQASYCRSWICTPSTPTDGCFGVARRLSALSVRRSSSWKFVRRMIHSVLRRRRWSSNAVPALGLCRVAGAGSRVLDDDYKMERGCCGYGARVGEDVAPLIRPLAPPRARPMLVLRRGRHRRRLPALAIRRRRRGDDDACRRRNAYRLRLNPHGEPAARHRRPSSVSDAARRSERLQQLPSTRGLDRQGTATSPLRPFGLAWWRRPVPRWSWVAPGRPMPCRRDGSSETKAGADLGDHRGGGIAG